MTLALLAAGCRLWKVPQPNLARLGFLLLRQEQKVAPVLGDRGEVGRGP